MRARRRPAPPPARRAAVDALLGDLRGSLANLRAAAEAAETLRGVGDGEGALRLGRVVLEESARSSDLVENLARAVVPRARSSSRRAVSELVAELDRRARVELDLPVDAHATVEAQTAAAGARLLDALLGALGRLRRDFEVARVDLRTRLHDGMLVLDLAWAAEEPELARLFEAHGVVLTGGARGEPALREAARAAGGEAWLSLDRSTATASLRLLLPLA